jgi:hypothetical protein
MIHIKILIIIILLQSCTSNTITKLEYYENTPIIKTKYSLSAEDTTLLDGTTTEYYRNGKEKIRLVFDNGLLKECGNLYDSSGKVLYASGIKNGNGVLKKANYLGEVVEEIEYKSGVPHGYYKNTLLSSTELYFKYGIPIISNKEDCFAINNMVSDSITAQKISSGFDPALADNIMQSFTANNVSQILQNAHSDYKEKHSLQALSRYFGFIQETYGKPIQWKRESYNLVGQTGLGEGVDVLYSIKFSYCKGAVIFSLLNEKGSFKFANLSVRTDDYTPALPVQKAAEPYIALIKSGKYQELYQNASTRFRSATPKAQFDQVTEELKKLGSLNSPQLYQHTIGLADNKLLLVAVYEGKFGSHEMVFQITLTEQSPGKFTLEGMQFDEAKQ